MSSNVGLPMCVRSGARSMASTANKYSITVGSHTTPHKSCRDCFMHIYCIFLVVCTRDSNPYCACGWARRNKSNESILFGCCLAENRVAVFHFRWAVAAHVNRVWQPLQMNVWTERQLKAKTMKSFCITRNAFIANLNEQFSYDLFQFREIMFVWHRPPTLQTTTHTHDELCTENHLA